MAGAVPKPKAGAERVEDLVALVMAGTLRIPQFQRPLEWSAADVVTLLESIYLGYPVGSLLFHRRAAEAQVAAVGPVKVAAPELSSARWVVDGQQRLIALAASLRRPEPIPSTPDDAFVVYFDPTTRSFQSPPETGEIPTTWVPGPLLLDASRLMEWLFQWPHAHERTLREAVIQAGAELRESTIPTYTVETDDVDVLRAIYHRINRHGNHLEWHEVHDALYGSRPGRAQPSTLTELADALADVGIGRPSEHDQLLRCLFAFEGHERDDLALHEGTIAAALPTLRRVLGFLRSYAGIPHLRLLPSFASLPILTRLFRLHPEPNPRTLDLLR